MVEVVAFDVNSLILIWLPEPLRKCVITGLKTNALRPRRLARTAIAVSLAKKPDSKMITGV